ncbi:hypothetical protein DSO57_1009440 [Entomophthora muscae]|uniref:Uncharacterized protein n=1 Tax=Entomophthora muscae TaxID=34485 RepID=A0ACC2TIA3_9FUNG|nr:hypothetical protein DSO57_1009440 [Entomophthora muscae]
MLVYIYSRLHPKIVGRSSESQKRLLHPKAFIPVHLNRIVAKPICSEIEQPAFKAAYDRERKLLPGFTKEMHSFLATGQNPNRKSPLLSPASTTAINAREMVPLADSLAHEFALMPSGGSKDQKFRHLQEKFKVNLKGILTEGKRSQYPLPLGEQELRELRSKILALSIAHPQTKSVVERLERALISPLGTISDGGNLKLTKEEFDLTVDVLCLSSTIAHPLLISIFNAIIYMHGLKGRQAVAFYLNQQLTERGVEFNDLTLAGLMNASLNSGDWRCALGLYDISRHRTPTDQRPVLRYTKEIAIKTMCLAGRIDEGLEIYRGLGSECSLECYEILLDYCLPSTKNTTIDDRLFSQALGLFRDCAKTYLQVNPATIKRLIQAALLNHSHFYQAEMILETATKTMGYEPPLSMIIQMLEACQKHSKLRRARRYLLLAIKDRDGTEDVLEAYVHLLHAYKNHFSHQAQPIKLNLQTHFNIHSILERPSPTQACDAAEEIEHVVQHIRSVYSHRPSLLTGRICEAQILAHLKLGCVERALTLSQVHYLDIGQLPPLGMLVYLLHRCFDLNLLNDALHLWKAIEPLLSVLWGSVPTKDKLRVRSQHFTPADTLASLYIVLINGMAKCNNPSCSISLLRHMAQDPTINHCHFIPKNFNGLQKLLVAPQNLAHLASYHEIMESVSRIAHKSDVSALSITA